jgi:hypothetical protein
VKEKQIENKTSKQSGFKKIYIYIYIYKYNGLSLWTNADANYKLDFYSKYKGAFFVHTTVSSCRDYEAETEIKNDYI